MEKDINYFKLMGLKSNAPKKTGMYFNEEYFCDLIKQYQASLEYDENNNIVNYDKTISNEIIANLLLIVDAIINKYGIWKFESVEVLQEEGLMECWRYIPNFDPSKGTCFNLFSMICKYHLISYTKKDKVNRTSSDVDIHPELESREELNYNVFIQDLGDYLYKVIKDNFSNTPKEQKYIELLSILLEYIEKNQQIIGKNDLMSVFRSYGYKTSEYKEFIKDLEPYKEELYDMFRKS